MNDVGLVEHLQLCLHSATPAERARASWIMNNEWLTECLSLTDPAGRLLWEPEPRESLRLFGLPVDVRDDGGVPHLEPAARD